MLFICYIKYQREWVLREGDSLNVTSNNGLALEPNGFKTEQKTQNVMNIDAHN